MRRFLGYLQGLLLTAGLLYLAFRGTDFSAVWRQVGQASWIGLLAAAAIQLLSLPVRTLRWQTLLKPTARRLPYRLMLEATILGYTVSAAVPGRLGELVRPGLVASRKKVALGPALGSILAERIVDGLTVLAILAAGLAVVPITGDAAEYAPLIRRAGLLSAVGMIAVTLALLVLISKQSLLERVAGRAGRLFGWLLRSLLAVSDGARVFRSPGLLARVALESAATWGLILLGFWVGLRAVGVEVSFASSLLLLPLIVLGVALPTPAGAGGFHAALVFGLSRLFGVDPSLAASAAILIHLVSIVPLLAVGGGILLTERFAFRDLLTIGREVRQLGSRVANASDEADSSDAVEP